MKTKGHALDSLISIVQELRGPKGCPWDKKQTPESLIKYMSEEFNELLAAIKKNDSRNVCEESGDVLFLLIILSEIYSVNKEFTFDDVISSISDKLIRRHPHVFSDAHIEDEDELRKQWERIKAQEKREKK